MMAMRTLLAAAVLITYVLWRFGWERTRADARSAWRHFLVLGALNAAIPFWLIAWGEQHIDSGLAAVVQASVPIFNALIVLKVLPHERLSGTRALGLGIGILGVAVVTGIHPTGGWLAIAGALRGRPLVALVRERGRVRAARRLGHDRPGARRRLDADGRSVPAPARALPAARLPPRAGRRSRRSSRSACSGRRSHSSSSIACSRSTARRGCLSSPI